MSLRKIRLTLAFLLLSGAAMAENPLRCPNGEFQEAQCEAIRTEALKVGCIDQPTYNRLKAEGRFPACVVATFVGDCPCGCFAPETLIDVLSKRNGEAALIAAAELFGNSGRYVLSSLEDNASLSSPRFVSRTIANATGGDESRPLVRVVLRDGQILRLTEKHPVLKASGEMTTARELTKGDTLVNREGGMVPIEVVDREKYKGQVYNFETNGESLASHIIVAEGVLVGDLAWQNSLEEELGGIAIRQ